MDSLICGHWPLMTAERRAAAHPLTPFPDDGSQAHEDFIALQTPDTTGPLAFDPRAGCKASIALLRHLVTESWTALFTACGESLTRFTVKPVSSAKLNGPSRVQLSRRRDATAAVKGPTTTLQADLAASRAISAASMASMMLWVGNQRSHAAVARLVAGSSWATYAGSVL